VQIDLENVILEFQRYGMDSIGLVRRKKDEFRKFSKPEKKNWEIFYFYFINAVYIRVFYNIYHIYSILPPPLEQLISCLQLREY